MNNLYKNASWFSKYFVLWPMPFIFWDRFKSKMVDEENGMKEVQGVRDPSECIQISDCEKSEMTLNKFLDLIKENKQKDKKMGVAGMIIKIFKWRLLLSLALCTITEILTLGYFLQLRFLLDWVNDEDDDNIGVGFAYCLPFILILFISSTLRLFFTNLTSILTMVISRGLSSLLYSKILQLSQKSIAMASTGKLVTLVSSEMSELERNIWMFPYIFSNLITLIISFGYFGYLYYEASAIGFFILIILMGFVAFLASKTGKTRLRDGECTDRRINHISDLINGIKTIKTYCWEKKFDEKIKDARNCQMKYVGKLHAMYSVIYAFILSLGYIVTIILFGYHWVMERRLEYSSALIVFSIGTIFSYRSIPLIFGSLNVLVQFFVICGRCDEVISMEDIEKDDPEPSDPTLVLKMDNVTATWGFSILKDIYSGEMDLVEGPTNNLVDITFEAKKQDFISIVGPVGSSKSTLLAAIMKELQVSKGSIEKKGKICYVEQDPYITSGSVLENILFGLPRDEDKLKRVIQACSLGEDIQIFENGIDTVIGERGIGISGGQKARISLARAAYSESDIILLDDPLSALDFKVAQAIYTNCIRKYMKDKCVILVTHQVQLLEDAPMIFVMDKGKIINRGSFDQLNSQDILNQKSSENSKSDEQNLARTNSNSKHSNLKEQQSKERFLSEEEEDEANPSSHSSSESSIESLDDNEFEESLSSISSPEGPVTSKNIKLSLKKEKSLAHALDMMNRKSLALNPIQRKSTMKVMPRNAMKSSAPINTKIDDSILFETVSLKDWIKLFSYGIGNFWFAIAALIIMAYSGLYVYTYYVLGKWTEGTKQEQQDGNDFYLYSGLVLASAILIGLAGYLVNLVFYTSAKSLHNKMSWSLARAPMHYFDKNSIGTILSRFSQDIRGLDEFLPTYFFFILRYAGLLLVTLISLIFAVPFILVIIVIASFAFYWIRRKAVFPTQNIEWLRSETLGPLNTKFSSLLDGIITVRAYGKEDYFLKEYLKDNDQVSNTSLTFYGVTRGIIQMSDMVGFCTILVNSISVLFIKVYTNWIDESFLALSLITSTNLGIGISFLCISYISVENVVKLVKKAMEFAEMPTEPALKTESDPPRWPKEGAITFDNVVMKYKGANMPSLKGLNINIRDQQKVGIKGRTGSGKSSVINTLFRLYEIESGTIKIDDVDISTIGVHCLRNSISYIPQSPFILTGTVKENIDPYDDFEEDRVLEVLKEVELDQYVLDLKEGLYTEVSQSNNVFSSGQKQLLCLARSILENKKILCLDEATANVDYETDQIIQETIRRKFKDCTVITVAHRLSTIEDSDQIVIIEKGMAQSPL